MKNIKVKSFCKVNLSLKVFNKLNNGYHNISSLITFCNLYDVITVSEIKSTKHDISFLGRFKRGIDKKSNSISKLLNLLTKKKILKNKFFKINITKNIPHGSGLGGGSLNAAVLLNFFVRKMKLKLSKKDILKLARQIGFDVPIGLEKKNTLLTGRKNEMIKLNQKFKLNMLILYPNLVCSTKKIFKKNKIINLPKEKFSYRLKKKKHLIETLQNTNNDLELAVIEIYPNIEKIINYIKAQKGCYFSRITGSGSACIGVFSNMKNAISAKKKIDLKYPRYWCVVSKTI